MNEKKSVLNNYKDDTSLTCEEAALREEINKGIADVNAGRVMTIEEAKKKLL